MRRGIGFMFLFFFSLGFVLSATVTYTQGQIRTTAGGDALANLYTATRICELRDPTMPVVQDYGLPYAVVDSYMPSVNIREYNGVAWQTVSSNYDNCRRKPILRTLTCRSLEPGEVSRIGNPNVVRVYSDPSLNAYRASLGYNSENHLGLSVLSLEKICDVFGYYGVINSGHSSYCNGGNGIVSYNGVNWFWRNYDADGGLPGGNTGGWVDCLSTPPTCATDILGFSPVAHYQLDENYNDGSTNNYHGTASGGATIIESDGYFGGAVLLDGSGDFVSVVDNDDLDSTNRMTVSYWVKPLNLGFWQGMVGKWALTDDDNSWMIRTSNPDFSKVNVYIADNCLDTGNNRIVSSSGALQNGVWTHVVAVYDGTAFGNSNRLRLYINGVLDSGATYDGTIPSSIPNCGSDFSIGRRDISGREDFNGYIDDVRVYDSVLSSPQVDQLNECSDVCVPVSDCVSAGKSCGFLFDGCTVVDCGKSLINLYGTTNSHVENGSELNYENNICGHVSSCDGSNAVLWLSSLTNSHVSMTEDTTYNIPVCSDYCVVEFGSCSDPTTTVVASLYAATNSHMSVGDDPNYMFKLCCGAAPPVITNFNYWAYPDGTKASDGDVFCRNHEVKLVSNAGANFWAYDGDDITNKHKVETYFWGQGDEDIDFFDNNLYFSSALLSYSENFIETVPAICDDKPEIRIIEPECGDNLSKGDNLRILLEIVNKRNVVTGNLTVGSSFYEFDNRVDGSLIEILHPLTRAGNLQVVLEGSNLNGGYTKDIVNVMVYDPTNSSAQYYVSSCIDSPEQFETFATPEVSFDASSTTAIRYKKGEPNDGITKLDIDDLFFEWTFIYPIGNPGSCDGYGRDFCTDDTGYNMYSFTKIFPTVNENQVRLAVTVPPELMTS